MNLMTVFFLQAPAAGPDGRMMWILLIAMFVIMYSFRDSPRKIKAKKSRTFVNHCKCSKRLLLPAVFTVSSRKLTIMT